MAKEESKHQKNNDAAAAFTGKGNNKGVSKFHQQKKDSNMLMKDLLKPKQKKGVEVLYICMEYCEGRNLLSFIRDGLARQQSELIEPTQSQLSKLKKDHDEQKNKIFA